MANGICATLRVCLGIVHLPPLSTTSSLLQSPCRHPCLPASALTSLHAISPWLSGPSAKSIALITFGFKHVFHVNLHCKLTFKNLPYLASSLLSILISLSPCACILLSPSQGETLQEPPSHQASRVFSGLPSSASSGCMSILKLSFIIPPQKNDFLL